ncbi:codanin-1 [Parasteatoda tepidariorum]|uniref:codanin-1 n=1 Tax=Parasteatoda tepidariorum TaxID=114398 RepID=UPI00077FBF68|nr:codanin-1 [Parasteatoda tepidariorum]
MDEFLNKLILHEIDANDVIEWLKSNKTPIPDLKSLDRSEFIPYFVDFIKSKCSWVCNAEKSNDLCDKEKTPSSPILHSNGIIDKQAHQRTPSPLQYRVSHQNSTIGNEKRASNTAEDKTKFQNQGKRVQVITLGCTPYKQKGNFSNSRYSSKSPDFKNGNDFPPMGNNKFYGKECGQPYYKSNQFVESKTENQYNKKNFVKAYDKAPNPCEKSFNADAFPPLGAKTHETKARRRITPTPIQAKNNYQSKFGNSNFTTVSERNQSEAFKTSILQESDPSLQQERELLKVTKNIFNIPSSVNSGRLFNEVKPDNVSIPNSVMPLNEVKHMLPKSVDTFVCPNPEKITMMDGILCVSEVYSFLLSDHLVPNVTSELYFLLELVTSRVSIEENPLNKGDIFTTVHNCVYFAVSVLVRHCYLLQMLDKATLISLEGIPYLIKFSPQLANYLQLCFTSRQDVSPLLPSLTGVPFQVEDDSKANFPDEYTFVCFKRQRDLFYEMLRNWHENTTSADTKFQFIFLKKARELISLNPSSINMFHLAKLIQSQLVASCMCLEVNEVYDELLNDIQKNFPDKFKKLQERFLTPSSSGGLNPHPSFYGIQIFFAELIVSAGSPSLNQHLVNVFVSRVLELNKTDIFSDEELSSLGTIRDKYVFLLHTLRLLGKFLGYLHFLPYSKEEVASSHVAKLQLISRQKATLPLNVSEILKDSIKQGHTVLTVPWVVEFISMVDPVGRNLENVLEVLKVLMAIYRHSSSFIVNIQSQLFLQVIIGWLFDVLQYQYRFYSQFLTVSIPDGNFNDGIDSLSIIDKQLIHSCCPYLIEFKVLIHNFLNGVQEKKRDIRKITPLTTTKSLVSKNSISMSQLEYRLEENFFFLHPSSVKKTTEFVSERMASKIISNVRTVITSMKLSVADDVSNDRQVKSSTMDPNVKQQYIDEILHKKLIEAFKETQNKISVLTNNIYEEISNVIPSLLSEDTKPKVIEMCCKIAFRMSVDKIFEWCNANLLLNAIKADIRNKVQQIAKSQTTDREPTQNFNLSVWMNDLRNIVVKVHTKSFDFDLNVIQSLILKIINVITNDTPNSIQITTFLLAIDFYVALFVNYPEKYCDQLDELFMELCSNCPEKVTLGKLLVCPQNFRFLMISDNLELTITKFVCLVRKLLDKKIFSRGELQSYVNDIQMIERFDLLKKQIDVLFC